MNRIIKDKAIEYWPEEHSEDTDNTPDEQ